MNGASNARTPGHPYLFAAIVTVLPLPAAFAEVAVVPHAAAPAAPLAGAMTALAGPARAAGSPTLTPSSMLAQAPVSRPMSFSAAYPGAGSVASIAVRALVNSRRIAAALGSLPEAEPPPQGQAGPRRGPAMARPSSLERAPDVQPPAADAPRGRIHPGPSALERFRAGMGSMRGFIPELTAVAVVSAIAGLMAGLEVLVGVSLISAGRDWVIDGVLRSRLARYFSGYALLGSGVGLLLHAVYQLAGALT